MASEVWAFSGSELNMYGGTISGTINAQADVDLRIYGIYDSMVGPIDQGHWDASVNQLVVEDPDNGWNGDLTFLYEGDSGTTTLSFSTLSNITVEAGGGGPVTVQIDIKPGSYPNSINLGSNGVVPVAILSSSTFEATAVDPDTVMLAGAGVAVRGKSNKSLAHDQDINADGLMDLVCQVETENLDPGQLQDGHAVLTGNLLPEFGGTPIEGSDEITIVPPE
jgi:hypothetical protein